MHVVLNGYSLFQQDLGHVDRMLERDWEVFRGARIFITGGTGLFGIWLVESLLYANARRNLGIRLAVLSRDPKRFLANRAPHLRHRDELRLVRGGLVDLGDVDGPFSHIVHAASESNVDNAPGWAARHLDAALEGTRRVLDMAARHHSQAVL